MESKGRKSRSRRVGWYAAAAVVTLAVALSFYMSNYISSEKEGKTLIQPGTQQAQLTLSDGSVIDVHRKEVSVNAWLGLLYYFMQFHCIYTLKCSFQSAGRFIAAKLTTSLLF